jgi:hypothetical protein
MQTQLHLTTGAWLRLPALAVLAGAILVLDGCATRRAPAKTEAKSEPAPGTAAAAIPLSQAAIELDGKPVTGWREADFAGRGDVRAEKDRIILQLGYMTGITWTNAFPKMDYEVNLEAMRVEGNDFFCGLTFPVGESPCSLIVGGWGGGVVGLSSIDGEDAANNETTKYLNFEKGRWYHIRLRVTQGSIQGWIDDEKVVNVETTGHTFSIRSEVEPSQPFGIATWSTTGAVKDIRVARVKR